MIYSVDFDGVCCEDAWPEIGQAKLEHIKYLKKLHEHGEKLILNTCRDGKLLDNAVAWCNEHGLYFDAHNENLPERIEQYGGDCRKISADVYFDDKNKLIEVEVQKWKNDRS